MDRHFPIKTAAQQRRVALTIFYCFPQSLIYVKYIVKMENTFDSDSFAELLIAKNICIDQSEGTCCKEQN